jgi:hypothetical protein
MAAAAALFGALGAAGDFGEQHAEATQAARDEIQKRILQDQQRQAFQQQQKEAQLRYKLEQQPQPVGPPVTAPGGQVYQRFRNLDGTYSVQQMPGEAAETQEQSLFRGLTSGPHPIMSPDDATSMIKQMYDRTAPKPFVTWDDDPNHPGQQIGTPRDPYTLAPIPPMPGVAPPTRSKPVAGAGGTGYEPDPQHPGMEIATKYGYRPDGTYGPIGSYSTVRPMDLTRQTSGGHYDAATGLWLPFASTQQRVMPGQGVPNVQAPQPPGGTGIEAPLASPRPGLPPDATFGPGFRGVDAAGQPLPMAAGPGAATAVPQQTPPIPTPQSVEAEITALPSAAGGYHNLDANGSIPPIPGIPSQILQTANDVIQGRDVTQVQPNIRTWGERLANKFGWPGQGALTPKDQVQIQEPASIIMNMLRNPQMLSVLDSTGSRALLRALPGEVPQGATLGDTVTREWAGGLYSYLNPNQLNYLQTVNQLRSLMGGFRKLTGGNVSEAQVTRYISELPDPVTTPNSAAAKGKLLKLFSELQVAMRYGYFPKEAAAGNAGAAPPPPPAPGAGAGQQQRAWTWPDGTPAPAIGTINSGHKYLGGDPSLSASWQEVKQ